MRQLTLIITAFLALLATAQTHYEGTIAVGGKAGASLSRVNFNPSVEQTMLPGMTAGVMFRYVEEKNFGLIAELNLTQRGWKGDVWPGSTCECVLDWCLNLRVLLYKFLID